MNINLGADLGLTVNGKRAIVNATLEMRPATPWCEIPDCGAN